VSFDHHTFAVPFTDYCQAYRVLAAGAGVAGEPQGRDWIPFARATGRARPGAFRGRCFHAVTLAVEICLGSASREPQVQRRQKKYRCKQPEHSWPASSIYSPMSSTLLSLAPTLARSKGGASERVAVVAGERPTRPSTGAISFIRMSARLRSTNAPFGLSFLFYNARKWRTPAGPTSSGSRSAVQDLSAGAALRGHLGDPRPIGLSRHPDHLFCGSPLLRTRFSSGRQAIALRFGSREQCEERQH